MKKKLAVQKVGPAEVEKLTRETVQAVGSLLVTRGCGVIRKRLVRDLLTIIIANGLQEAHRLGAALRERN